MIIQGIWILNVRCTERYERTNTRQFFFSSEFKAKAFYNDEKSRLITELNTCFTRDMFIADLVCVEPNTNKMLESYRLDTIKLNKEFHNKH